MIAAEIVDAGAEPGGDLDDRPLRLTKVTLFTMIFHNPENSIRDIRPFVVHCCVTAVL